MRALPLCLLAFLAGCTLPGRLPPDTTRAGPAEIAGAQSWAGRAPLLAIPAGTAAAAWKPAAAQAVAAARQVKPDADFAVIARAPGTPDAAASALPGLAPLAGDVAAALSADGAAHVALGASSGAGAPAILIYAR